MLSRVRNIVVAEVKPGVQEMREIFLGKFDWSGG
jgi:hypothetical protein